MDSRLGMYPKLKRTGDKDRSGNNPVVPFDDRETVVFQNQIGNLLFGTLVSSGSRQSLLPYAGNNNPNNGITGIGNTTAGISDLFHMTDYKEIASRKNDNENLSPFDESRIILKDSQFFLTGTDENVYSGFKGRLHDKTQIVIDITPSVETEAGLVNKSSTANVSDDSSTMQPYLTYYNFSQKKWEGVSRGVKHGGNGTSPAFLAHQRMLQSGTLAFGPIGAAFTGSARTPPNFQMYPDDYYAALFRPVESFGFPFAMKYHASSSNVLRMGDYIKHPFLLEKIVFDVAVKLDAPNHHTG